MIKPKCSKCYKQMYSLYGRPGLNKWVKVPLFYCFNCEEVRLFKEVKTHVE